MSAEQLWAQLRAGGLVEGEMPREAHPASPWYVRAMLGIAGWIGALFLLMFAGVGFWFILDEGSAAAVVGALCCAAAWLLFGKFEGNDFTDQFALVISLVGQALLVVGIAQMLDPRDPGFYLAVAATEAALALIIPNLLHRALATTGAALALALAINQLSLYGLSAPLLCAGLTLVWLRPSRWAARGRVWRPIGYGIVLALLLIELFRLFGLGDLMGISGEAGSWFALHGPLLGRAITAAILVWAAFVLARREGLAIPGRAALSAIGAATVFGLLSLNAPGLASSVLILLLGFAAANRLLMALGILSLLGFVTHFYYSLHATLLEKSGLLAITGLCLLAAYILLRRGFLSSGAETNHG